MTKNKSHKPMKKAISLLIFLSVCIFAISDGTNNTNIGTSGNQNLLNGSDPAGNPVYSFTPVSALKPDSAFPSLISFIYAELATDFVLDSDAEIKAVRWYFIGDTANVSKWYITIYSNSSCSPGSQLDQWEIDKINVTHDLTGYTSFWTSLPTSFSALSGITYFISIQAQVTSGFPRWCYNPKSVPINCPPYYRFDLGSTPWDPAYFYDKYYEPYFVLYSEAEETPIDNWSVYLLILLIMGSLLYFGYRYRRVVTR